MKDFKVDGIMCFKCDTKQILEENHRKLHSLSENDTIKHKETNKEVEILEKQSNGYVAQAKDEEDKCFIPQEKMSEFKIPN